MLLPECVDDYVGEDNSVRALDVFVDGLDLGKLGFVVKAENTVGPPLTYERAALLKLLIYGYLNGIRSARQLEKEARRNLEIIWLTEKAQSDFWVINQFRKVNATAFKQVLRQFHRVCMELNLFGRELAAIDGSFFKALNNKSNNFTQARLDRLESRIDAAIETYNEALDQADIQEVVEPAAAHLTDPVEDREQGGSESPSELEPPGEAETSPCGPDCPQNLRAQGDMAQLKAKKRRIEQLRAESQASPSGQYSGNDPDSRMLKKGSQSVVGHNVQAVIDGKHHLLTHVQIVQSGNDRGQLEPMARAGCEALGMDPSREKSPDFLADAGYYHAAQIARCEEAGLRMHVPIGKTTAIDRPGYRTEEFTYDPHNDEYVCPEGRRLVRHADTRQKEIVYRVYYQTSACRDCPCRSECTKGSYRKLKISQYWEVERRVARRLVEEPEIYARRMGLVEHPFGTLKAIWGYRQFMVTGAANCEGELNLMAFSYNWKRVLKEVGTRALIEAIRALFRAWKQLTKLLQIALRPLWIENAKKPAYSDLPQSLTHCS